MKIQSRNAKLDMGADIHQLNIIWDSTKGTYYFEGPDHPFKAYVNGRSYDVLQELVPFRNYLLFGIIAGVRSEAYQIENVHCGYPKEMGTNKDIDIRLEDWYQYLHTPVWYYFSELQQELLITIKRLKKDIKKTRKKHSCLFSLDDEWEVEDMMMMYENCLRMSTLLNESKEKLTEEEFTKSIVFFVFDS